MQINKLTTYLSIYTQPLYNPTVGVHSSTMLFKQPRYIQTKM